MSQEPPSGPPRGWNPEQRYVTSDGEPPSGPPPITTGAPPPYSGPISGTVLPAGPFVRIPLFPYIPHHTQFSPWPPTAPGQPPSTSQPPASVAPPRIPGDRPSVPPTLRASRNNPLPLGVDYIFPARHTMLHIFHRNLVPYTRPGQEMKFNIRLAPTNMTVRELIDQLGIGGGDATLCGISECLELGDGRWAKGLTIFKSNANVDKTLGDVGWDEARGDDRMPVWLCLHQG